MSQCSAQLVVGVFFEGGSLGPPSREKRRGLEGSGAKGEQVWA